MKWITISRKMGVHGSDIAKRVASDLGYRFYDTEAISHMAQELGVLESVRAIDEKAPSFFQRIFSHRPIVYLDRLYSVLYEVAKQGDAVFLGRGSHLLLRDFPCALHVWVTASPETRIRTLLDQGWTREAAARALKRSDDERSALVKFAFGVDWEDPARYDLVLNMDKLSVNVAVSTVLHVVRSPDISDDSTEAIRALGMLALAHRAEAALMEATGGQGFTSSLSVAVVEPGTVRVSGDVDTADRKATTETLLRSVKGVDSIENAIRVVHLPRGALRRRGKAGPT
jgi:cytidylate kinase